MATEKPIYTIEDLTAVVEAGLPIKEAKDLLESGFAVADVMELAVKHGASLVAAAAQAQTATAKAMQKAMRPENETHPGKSAFSYPEGDVAKPRVPIPHEFYWNAYPCHKFPETLHWRECELIAQVTPGTFTLLRKDGSLMTVDVLAQRNASGEVTRIDVRFPIGREDKWLIPPMPVTLYQLVHPDFPQQRFIEGMNEWLLQIMGPKQPAPVVPELVPA